MAKISLVLGEIFLAMPLPIANFELLTDNTTGPPNGATLSTFILVPGVSPMSKSL